METMFLPVTRGNAVYGLWCDLTQMVYIGFTKNVAKRLKEHRCLLRHGKHGEPSLQREWDAYGEVHFRIGTLEYLPELATVEEKRLAELGWMDKFAAEGRLYNERRISFQPPIGASAKAAAARVANGFRWSAETNLKRSLAQLGKPKPRKRRDSLLFTEGQGKESADKEPQS